MIKHLQNHCHTWRKNRHLMFNGEKSCTKSFSPPKIEKLLVHILTTFPFKWQKKNYLHGSL